MIEPGVFSTDPWSLTERTLRLDLLGQTESLFALSNGHIGLRGNLDEGEPHVTPGSYLNGFFELLPMPYAEAGYGYPGARAIADQRDRRQALATACRRRAVRCPLRHIAAARADVGPAGRTLRREVEWVSPAGQAVRVSSTRIVSLVQRSIAAVRYEVEPIGDPARIVVQSSLVANEEVPERRDDPRAAAALRAPIESEYHRHNGLDVSLGHRTHTSGLRMAAGLDHVFECSEGTATESMSEPNLARVGFSTELVPGQSLTVIKLLAYGWSSTRSMPALRDQVDAALSAAMRTGWDGLLAEQRAYLDDLWGRFDVEIDGDPALQQAVRFAIFQLVQASARAENRALPAKGLTGRGYDGHTFWDQEMYVLPVLTYSLPEAARDVLEWRHATLPQAKARARELRLAGAAFPWRTIRGEECSGYWPAGTAAFHINAGIADAVRRYVAATDDTEFEAGVGLELLVETARLWQSLGHHDAEGCFRIDGVTGPDEYTALVSNNVYTNLMAARNFRSAADATARHQERAAALGVDGAEAAAWRTAADAMVIPFDEELGVTAQSEGFTRYRHWDFENTKDDEYPLLLHFPYYQLYSSQVIKQADLVFALYACGDSFDIERKRRDFEYYERITVRDSSLSAAIQAIVAAEVGHVRLAYDYFRESALVDLQDLDDNTDDGLHLAALAGTIQAVVAGFGGARHYDGVLAFAPRLPEPLSRVALSLARSRPADVRGDRSGVDLVPPALR